MIPDTLDAAALSGVLPFWAYAFVAVLCRTGAAITLLPGLAEDGMPMTVRMGIAFCLTILLAPVEAHSLPPMPDSIFPLLSILAWEICAGILLGWLARLAMLSLPAAGQIVSMATGLSSVLQPDSNFGAQTAAIGRLFGVAAPVLILASGAYVLPLEALAGSYAALPPGPFPPMSDMLDVATRAVAAHLALALRLAAPFLLTGMVWQVGLGLLSRLVPQIQIYFASLPGQVLGGLLLLGLLIGAMAQAWLSGVGDAFAHLPGS